MTRSLQLIPPTTVAVLRALEIILAYLAQVESYSQSFRIPQFYLADFNHFENTKINKMLK